MKKLILFFVAVCAIAVACKKAVKEPTVVYTVETVNNKALEDIYVPDKGSYTFSMLVKYLGGPHEDSVTVKVSGFPGDVKLSHDSLKVLPTSSAAFYLTTDGAVHKTYTITITTTSPGNDPQVYHINMTIISADCASVLWGDFTGSNQCTARNYTYTATGVATGTVNELDIVNFGGYGANTLTHVIINCNNDSLTIPQQNIGNGTNLSGRGKITGNTLNIYYDALTTPGGSPESCNVVLTKQ